MRIDYRIIYLLWYFISMGYVLAWAKTQTNIYVCFIPATVMLADIFLVAPLMKRIQEFLDKRFAKRFWDN